MKNRYAGTCGTCGERVAAGAGACRKDGRRWVVWCKPCADAALEAWRVGQPSHGWNNRDAGRVIVSRTSGSESYVNSRGRCEDAPCCGCCS